MPEMNTQEFKYYKDTVDKDIREHATQVGKVNSPDEVILGYNGRFKDSEDNQVENYLFIAASTILPSFY